MYKEVERDYTEKRMQRQACRGQTPVCEHTSSVNNPSHMPHSAGPNSTESLKLLPDRFSSHSLGNPDGTASHRAAAESPLIPLPFITAVSSILFGFLRHWLTEQTVRQSVSHPVSQSVSQKHSQPPSQSVRDTASHPVSQSEI